MATNIGENIRALRKKSGLSQEELGAKLNLSCKAVSKWETGKSFPDISLLPKLAEIFNVSIDYLMSGNRKGIAVLGHAVLDTVYMIDEYPEIGHLANITHVKKSVGGCVPNTIIDLAKIDRTLPLTAITRIGDDENGRFLVGELTRYGIDVERISVSEKVPTGFSNVMSLANGERTFFFAEGSNAELSASNANIQDLDCKIMHVGYINLLNTLDSADAQYGTQMARILAGAKERGIKTSADLVSNNAENLPKVLKPALKYLDYLIANEFEVCAAFGLSSADKNGEIIESNVLTAMRLCKEAGVKEKVIIHAKNYSWLLNCATNSVITCKPIDIPREFIKGSVGAGDAFAAGCLYALVKEYSDRDLLLFANGAASASLYAENSVDSMKNAEEIKKLIAKYGECK